MVTKTDVLVIGCGIAGTIAALKLADRGMDVLLISCGKGAEGANSYWAQGGISYYGKGEPEGLFKEDILKAGGGLCKREAVDHLCKKGPQVIEEILLHEIGVPFEKEKKGEWKLTREAAHSTFRILHYKDQSGKAIMEAVFKKVNRHPKITQKFAQTAIDLMIPSPKTCVGAYILDQKTGEVVPVYAQETILATGGVGQCFLHTSNTKEAQGDGIAMAHRAGAKITNMEYVQFHPTTLYVPGEPRFLLTEALRGEGALILSHDKTPSIDPLAPRDTVARQIFEEMQKSQRSYLWLDTTHKPKSYLMERFPTIYRHCLGKGWDMSKDLLPIVPAVHYSCGGVQVDLEGRTSIKGLRAIGEVSCTGVHGANRLASTSLLEGVVWAKEVADSVELTNTSFPQIRPPKIDKTPIDKTLIDEWWQEVKQTMWNNVGLTRSETSLKKALKTLQDLKLKVDNTHHFSLRSGCQTALLIAKAALNNPKSLGCHYRILEEKSALAYTDV